MFISGWNNDLQMAFSIQQNKQFSLMQVNFQLVETEDHPTVYPIPHIVF